MLKVASLALVLIQYTLYNRLIVWVLFFFNFILKVLWYKLATGQNKENINCNWYTFTQQFVKQNLKKEKKKKRTMSSITPSSFLWNKVEVVGGVGGGFGRVETS